MTERGIKTRREKRMTELAKDAIKSAKIALSKNMEMHTGDVTTLAIALIEAEQKERKQ